MNVFLNLMLTSPGKIRFLSGLVGDITSLPECLTILYDDQSTDKWCFYLVVPTDTAWSPSSAIEQSLNIPAGGDEGPKSLFDKLLKRGPLPSSLRSANSTSPRDYTILPGGFPAEGNPLGFSAFTDKTSGQYFSGYAVVNGTMVWKLPTFQYPSDFQNDVINFWNAMVEAAKEQKIKKLIIDISENGGGSLTHILLFSCCTQMPHLMISCTGSMGKSVSPCNSLEPIFYLILKT